MGLKTGSVGTEKLNVVERSEDSAPPTKITDVTRNAQWLI